MEFASLSDALISLIPTYGPWIIFGVVGFESAGVPLPGETILVAAALLAATTAQITIVVVVLAAATGAIVGDGLGYMVGRRLGSPFLRRYGRYIRLDEDRLLIGRYLFFSMATPSCSLGVSLQCCECLRLCLRAPIACRQVDFSSSI
jgi:membrane protein DedA with SNARE-associated domain